MIVGSENFFYIVTLIVGLIGSLNVGLRIVAPLIVKLARCILRIIAKRKNRPNNHPSEIQQSMAENPKILFYVACILKRLF